MKRTRLLGWGALVLAAAAGAAGCSDTDERPVSWAYISATIVQPNCATSRCHSEGSEVAGLRFDTVELGYQAMQGYGFVMPDLLRGQNGVVQRMPPDAPLPEGDIELIEKWLAAGGENN